MTRRVSIVVNTYNRGDSLRRTLQSFTYLDYPEFEVVVVNGPSTDNTAAVIAEFADRIKVGNCANRNLSESRNIGVALAAGEIVAFIDDDAYPDPAWLDRLVEGYDDDEVAAVGGPVYDHTGAALQARYTFGTRLGDARVGIDEANPTELLNTPWSVEFVNTLGTNSSFRRDRLIGIGGFDEEFEYYLDENSVCWRLVEQGWVVKALDDGYVYHKFLPSDVRGENRAARNRYQVIKSKCFFALKHGLGVHSFYEVCQSILGFVENQRADYRWCVANGLLTEEDLKQFESDVHAAFDAALWSFASHVDKTRSPEWFAERQQPFLPFTVRRPASDKLHICFFSQEYPPGPVNGIARFVHTLATGLAAEGHLVRVLTRGESHDRVDLEEGVWVHRIVIEEHPLPDGVAVPPALWNYSASLLDELLRIDSHRKVDLVQGPNWDSELIAVVLDGGFTTVLSLHTPLATVQDVEPAVVSGNPYLEQMLALDRLCLDRSTALLANGDAVVAAIEDRYELSLPRDKLAIIPHGVPDKGGIDAPDLHPETVEVLFVGRLEQRKGIDTLLAAIPDVAREFPEARFVLVGDDTVPSETGVPHRVAFERSPAAAELGDRVRFTGLVDDEELEQWYACCDIFVAPSRFESFGLVLVEAMALGKPVVAGDNAGMRSIVEEGSNGYLVSPDDPDALKEALGRLISSADLRREFGDRSRRLFEERYSVAAMVEQTNRFYDSLLPQRTATTPARRPDPSPPNPTARRTSLQLSQILSVSVPPQSGPVVLDTLAEQDDELVASYENKFSEAIDKGESIYLPMTPMERAGHERKMELLDALPVGDLSDKVCVDFGVGSWGFACVYPRLQRCGFAIGIDISAEAIRESARLSAAGNFPYGDRYAYLTSRGDDIKLQDGSVDVFFSGECIEHVENTDAFLDEAHRVLAPGGLLILTTPNADAHLYRLRGERYCPGAEHVSLMGLDELLTYVEPRFDVIEIKGVASSLHHSFDREIADAEFARSWVMQFEDQPHLASGLLVLARRRESYVSSRYDEWRFHHSDPSVTYGGQWRVATLHDALSAHLADSGGSSELRVEFSGTDLLVFLWAHAWSGHALVSVDDLEQSVDLYAPESGFRRLHFRGLENRLHELRISQTGVANPDSQGTEVIFHQAISYRRRS